MPSEWTLPTPIGLFQAALLCMVGMQSSRTYAVNPPSNRHQFKSTHILWQLEILDEQLLHVRIEHRDHSPIPSNEPMPHSIMVLPQTAKTGLFIKKDGFSLRTAKLQITILPEADCLEVIDIEHGHYLNRLCAGEFLQAEKKISLFSGLRHGVYGLGQIFTSQNDRLSWTERIIEPGPFGNELRGFQRGAVGFTQFPALYVLGEGSAQYGMFFDHVYRMRWDFSESVWWLRTYGDDCSFYIWAEDDLNASRKRYLSLTGTPRSLSNEAFGLWVSKYGYRNWEEIDDEIAALNAAEIPVRGFALDMQWYGGRFGSPDESMMGRLSFDPNAFPDAEQHIKRLKDHNGISLMTIEQPYVAQNLSEHADLSARQFLVKDCEGCGPTFLNYNPWWGRGGMLDFTNEAAARYWDEIKRRPLRSLGITAHWLDLGEPEQYNYQNWYTGAGTPRRHAQADVHNLYNIFWLKSLFSDPNNSAADEPSFVLTRSGAPGMQRYKAALWSGDIGSDKESLRAQLRSSAHLSMLGMEYYGSDVGGYYRSNDQTQDEALYTTWFANASVIEIPLRPHVWNLNGKYTSSPARFGDIDSNRFNMQRRVQLNHLYKELSQRAEEFSEPMFAPFFYYLSADLNARNIWRQRWIGKNHFVTLLDPDDGATTWSYIPAGRWRDFDSGHIIQIETPQWLRLSTLFEGKRRAPILERVLP